MSLAVQTSLDTVGSQIQPIGTWSVTARHALGMVVRYPGKPGVDGPRTFMYVNYVKGSGSDLFQGTPVGLTTATADGNFVVSGDQSAVFALAPIGICWSNSTSAVTTAYYGWIQLAVAGEILKSCLVTSMSAAGDRVIWQANDRVFATQVVYDSTKVTFPVGVIVSGSTTIIATGSSLISTAGVADVFVGHFA